LKPKYDELLSNVAFNCNQRHYTEAEAHAQLDYAVKERGVNFIDTAEMYPVPSSAPGRA